MTSSLVYRIWFYTHDSRPPNSFWCFLTTHAAWQTQSTLKSTTNWQLFVFDLKNVCWYFNVAKITYSIDIIDIISWVNFAIKFLFTIFLQCICDLKNKHGIDEVVAYSNVFAQTELQDSRSWYRKIWCW